MLFFFLSFVPKTAEFYAGFQIVEKDRTKEVKTVKFYLDNYELFPAFSKFQESNITRVLSYIEFLPIIILVLFVDNEVNPVQNRKLYPSAYSMNR